MNLLLTKRQVRKALGHDAAVARFFEISTAAVAQWDLDKPIPALRVLQAMAKRPDLFGTLAAEPAANDDVGPAREEHGEGVTAASVDVEGAERAESKVHAESMDAGQGARYVRGDAS
ncbi:hypothetical protein [Luteimonas fraxinea]|uniref:XRE family transcriptional regulator n=1 Tax=Luteimonas fraxinea TaxID=2901869 RepID=A0ABS8UE96_9GAMM|nr:hypothetical protein [Luteimonas fraxinea]MCD9097066.1 hypothetical protein [Luteimonas fraxinea]